MNISNNEVKCNLCKKKKVCRYTENFMALNERVRPLVENSALSDIVELTLSCTEFDNANTLTFREPAPDFLHK